MLDIKSVAVPTGFPCPVESDRLPMISREGCHQHCGSYSINHDKCVTRYGCESPFRLCLVCLKLGLRAGDGACEVSGPRSTKCSFHEKHGDNARPPIQKKEKRPERFPTTLAPPPSSRPVAPKVSPTLPRTPEVPQERGAASVRHESVVLGREIEVDCWQVVPLTDQPRTYFDDSDFAGLVNSIRSAGQLQTVPAVSLQNGMFRISDGERRWRACRALGKKLRIIIVPELPHEEEIERSAISNFNRQEHTAIEKARIFLRLKNGLGRSVTEMASKFGVTNQTIRNYLLLLEKLHPSVIDLMDPVLQGSKTLILNPTIGLLLTPFFESHPEVQVELAQSIFSKKLKVQQAKNLIARKANELGVNAGRGRESRPADHRRIVERMFENVRATLGRFAELTQEQHQAITLPYTPDVREKKLREFADTAEHLRAFAERLRG